MKYNSKFYTFFPLLSIVWGGVEVIQLKIHNTETNGSDNSLNIILTFFLSNKVL